MEVTPLRPACLLLLCEYDGYMVAVMAIVVVRRDVSMPMRVVDLVSICLSRMDLSGCALAPLGVPLPSFIYAAR